MIKVILFLLLVVLIPANYANAQACCSIDRAIDAKIKAAVDSKVSATLAKSQLTCTTIKTSGALAACLHGYTVTGCSCGKACGSWDVRDNSTCHCQCANVDWTAARCCKIVR
ncbi:resistin [Anolis carolinensis]|uniref:Resistin n=1 Tax=Anolis carolinensis TaxID=28377 RepID=A0A803T5X9_ANOCA|nr:PREDICTED: resistin-like [Anolis carolinensis]|eukprot:XP_016846768.1 PREDICTED: resistin-like [Anolis carolinensis]